MCEAAHFTLTKRELMDRYPTLIVGGNSSMSSTVHLILPEFSITQAISPVEKSLTIIPLVPRSESCSLRYGVRCILSFLADSQNTSIIVGNNMIGKRLEILWNEAFLKVCGNKN